jgi:Right handed beta helix region
MKRLAITLLTLAVASIGGQAASIPITYVPYTITAPGSYYLATDLVVVATNTQAIIINQPASGNITLDMRGHQISVPIADLNYAIGISGGLGNSVGSVVIQNGTLLGFENGIDVEFTNHVTVNNLTISSRSANGNGRAINISQSQNLTVENCSFIGATDCGIFELSNVPTPHNVFLNLRFAGTVGKQILMVNFGSSVIPLLEN